MILTLSLAEIVKKKDIHFCPKQPKIPKHLKANCTNTSNTMKGEIGAHTEYENCTR